MIYIKPFRENLQLADKTYFNTGILSVEDKEKILKITNGDSYTKIISDMYVYLKKYSFISSNITELYDEVKNYNKNVFPIKGYDIYNPEHIGNLIHNINLRKNIMKEIKILPSIALRNMRNDIRQERDMEELSKYKNDIEYFNTMYMMLNNRPEEVQANFAKKMFKKNTTLKDLMQFVDDKSEFMGGVDLNKDYIKELSENEDLDIIYEQGNAMIVEVYSPSGIKKIGCNSLWCFTYGTLNDVYQVWNSHSYNDIVYVLINFDVNTDSEDFMHVVIKPILDDEGELIVFEDSSDDSPVYNMANENYSNPQDLLSYLFGENYESIAKQYLTFDYD